MLKPFLFLCSLSLFLTSCGNEVRESSSELTPILSINPDDTVSEFLLSKIVNEVEYIKLKSPSESTVGEVMKILFHDDLIYVSDYNNSLFCFNEDGNFVYRINRPGRGVGEYVKLVDFTIDRDEGELIISDDYNLFFYDLQDGSFSRKVPIPSPSYRIEYAGNGTLIYDAGMNTNQATAKDDHLSKILVSDMNGNVTDQFFSYDRILYGTSNIYYKTQQFFSINESLLVNPIFENTVHYFSNGEMKKKYTVDFGNKSVSEEMLGINNFHEFLAASADYAILADVIDFGSSKLVYYTYRDKPFISVFINHSGKPAETFFYNDLKNDVDGLPVAPFQAITANGKLVSILYPHDLLNARKESSNNQSNKKLTLLTKDLSEFDNPIIALYHSK